jgi:hypothetical protein
MDRPQDPRGQEGMHTAWAKNHSRRNIIPIFLYDCMKDCKIRSLTYISDFLLVPCRVAVHTAVLDIPSVSIII